MAAETHEAYDPGERVSRPAVSRDGVAGRSEAESAPAGPEEHVGPALRDKVAQLGRLTDEVLELATDAEEAAIAGGELGGLLDLIGVIDRVQAAAVELTARARSNRRAERVAGLPLEQVLAFRSKSTYPDRRTLLAVAETLPALPNVRQAFHAGWIGWAQVRAIVYEVRNLTGSQRAQLDEAFLDQARLERLDPDVLVDEVRAAADRLRPDLHEARETRRYERRFVHAQTDIEGGVGGLFELPGEEGARFLEALAAAAPAPSARTISPATHPATPTRRLTKSASHPTGCRPSPTLSNDARWHVVVLTGS